MFPNPQDALPLPLKPNVERYKKLAKDLVKACKSGDPEAIGDWAEEWVKSLVKLSGIVITRHLPVRIESWANKVEEYARRKLSHDDVQSHCRLADAQFIIARSHGFLSWPKFVKHIESLTRRTTAIARFEAAADAIITGDIDTLKKLLEKDPELVRMRSTREHRATLLHYVSANGVEGYRQKTPKNAVKITELLLKAGAEVDAEADVYGGGATTLGLAATSLHPFVTGVQNPLIQILLDHGAQIDHKTSGGNQQSAVMACLANGRGEAAVYLADHGAYLDLESAAGVGRLDVVKSYFNERGRLKPKTTKKQLQLAFLYACDWGRNNVVEFLLDKGVNLKGHGGDGQTATHWAAIGGHLDTIKLLLKHNPPLEARNMYGGTVLGQTEWSAAHGGDPELYAEIIETLIAAGAKVPERHVPINKRIDDLLRRYGSVPEPTWYWYGEKPRRPTK
jgi:ankyrin repeat protein